MQRIYASKDGHVRFNLDGPICIDLLFTKPLQPPKLCHAISLVAMLFALIATRLKKHAPFLVQMLTVQKDYNSSLSPQSQQLGMATASRLEQ
jgi:hypothetical protein